MFESTNCKKLFKNNAISSCQSIKMAIFVSSATCESLFSLFWKRFQDFKLSLETSLTSG